MDTQQKFVKNLQVQIERKRLELNSLETAYGFFKDMSEEIFRQVMPSGTSNPHVEEEEAGMATATVKQKQSIPAEYGRNVALVNQLLVDNPKGLRKSDIIERFPDKDLYTVEELYQTVTNALSYMNQNNKIEKYKPLGIVMKGYYWKLKKQA